MAHVYDARGLAEAIDGALVLDQRQAIHDVVRVRQPGAGQGCLQAFVLVLAQVPLGQVGSHPAFDTHCALAAWQVGQDQVGDQRDLILASHRSVSPYVVFVQP